MKDDAVFNIKFVQAVEKHPCLYNNTLAEYSRKDISDNAWKVVAEEVDETGKMPTPTQNIQSIN